MEAEKNKINNKLHWIYAPTFGGIYLVLGIMYFQSEFKIDVKLPNQKRSLFGINTKFAKG